MVVKFGVWARCEDGPWADQEPTFYGFTRPRPSARLHKDQQSTVCDVHTVDPGGGVGGPPLCVASPHPLPRPSRAGGNVKTEGLKDGGGGGTGPMSTLFV